ncbi:hypothetical protein A9Q96_13840 [Rhodobacterales bacterium 52_120_T64]|nr:hypothetical protein A9Q96_13840 [Rhodobacterales bacterium 52_120_T64]
MKNRFPIERMTETRTAILGAYIVTLGSISTSIYTPALPEMVLGLGTTDAAMKFSVSIFFAGFAISQLFCGPLSDIYGRRPVTISFLLLYILASFAAMVSTSIEMLLVSRLIQGVGAAIAFQFPAQSSEISIPASRLRES